MIALPTWEYDDGGREAAGYRGNASDCVVRATAIAADIPYQVAYDAIYQLCKGERTTQRRPKKSSPRNGVRKSTWKPYLESFGFVWTPTMSIGSGCKVHLCKEELPPGRLVVQVSKHVVAVVDGVVRDTYDCTRDGKRCVYGYFRRVS